MERDRNVMRNASSSFTRGLGLVAALMLLFLLIGWGISSQDSVNTERTGQSTSEPGSTSSTGSTSDQSSPSLAPSPGSTSSPSGADPDAGGSTKQPSPAPATP